MVWRPFPATPAIEQDLTKQEQYKLRLYRLLQSTLIELYEKYQNK